MKKIALTIFSVAAILTGCNKNVTPYSEEKGRLSLTVVSSDSLTDKDINVKSVEQSVVDNFDVVITSSSGETYDSFKVSECPPVMDMVPGEYTIKVSSPEQAPVAWDQPVFEGSKSFVIVRNVLSPVEVECAIKNVKVSVNCTEKFLNEVENYDITITTSDGSLTWNEEDVNVGPEATPKSAWFNAAPMTVYIKGYRKIKPTEVAELDFKISDVQARDHIILNIDAKTTGSAQFEISVDGTLNDKNMDIEVPGFPEVPVPGGDPDPEKPETEGPSLTWEANPDFGVTPLQEQMDVNIVINAPAGIKGLVVTVDSKVLNPMISGMNGGSLDMDLVNPTSNLEEILLGVGLPLKDQVVGKKTLPFSLSDLVPMIISVGEPDTLAGDHSFTLKVTDANGKEFTRTLVFRYEA